MGTVCCPYLGRGRSGQCIWYRSSPVPSGLPTPIITLIGNFFWSCLIRISCHNVGAKVVSFEFLDMSARSLRILKMFGLACTLFYQGLWTFVCFLASPSGTGYGGILLMLVGYMVWIFYCDSSPEFWIHQHATLPRRSNPHQRLLLSCNSSRTHGPFMVLLSSRDVENAGGNLAASRGREKARSLSCVVPFMSSISRSMVPSMS